MKPRLTALSAAAAGLWALKRYYADADADALWWILQPTATIAGAITRTTFVSVSGEGWFSPERVFLIEKSCAGINFMIAAAAMLAFVLVGRAHGWMSCARALAISAGGSYAAAVLVNSVRISIAMWLAAHPLAFARVSGEQLHRLEGIVIYFGGLVLLYELVQRAGPARSGRRATT